MSNAVTVALGPITSAAPPEGVRRAPLYFESEGQWLFAWLDRREPAPHTRHGVLICPPVGHEQVHTHRSLRHLADAVAEAGFPVLRFDYHGTGDSGGSGEEPGRVAAWLANIRDARSWLETQFGCERVTLIGLRVGATLAVQAAAGRAVDGLLLWAPVVRGRSFVREMKALSLTAAGGARPTADIEAAGFVMTEETAGDLGRLDLLQCRPSCRRALVMTPDDAPTAAALLDHFLACGIDAGRAALPGYADMMAEPHYTKVPHDAITRAVDWLRAGADPVDAGDRGAAPVLQAAAGFTFPTGPRIGERVLTIGTQPQLFGVLTEPPDAAPDGAPLVVLLNAGSAYRVGPNRLYVPLARRLAARGFRCLRVDLCGLGDSVTPYTERENDPYPATAFRDVDQILRHLRTALGVDRVVLMGLCSGAYTAFQAAAQLPDPVLVESVLINPLTFFWREGMSLESSPALRLKAFQDGVRSVWQPEKWLKLLCGRSKIGIGGAVRLLLERWKLRSSFGRQTAVDDRDDPPSHPRREDLPGDLQRVMKAGRHLACFFARSDPGYGILMLGAARLVKRLRRAGRIDIHFIDDADHTFSRRAARDALTGAITEHLAARYLRATP